MKGAQPSFFIYSDLQWRRAPWGLHGLVRVNPSSPPEKKQTKKGQGAHHAETCTRKVPVRVFQLRDGICPKQIHVCLRPEMLFGLQEVLYKFILSGASGAVAETVAFPIDLIKTRCFPLICYLFLTY
jgi:hypothetical protein